MKEYDYIINGQRVRNVCRKQKPYCIETYTCINSTTDKESRIAYSTNSTTEYTTTSWESRMSTYQRVTTIRSYDNSVPYQYETTITSTRTELYSVTNYCCCGCDDCCVETNIVSGGKETINTTTKKYNRYTTYKTLSSKTTSEEPYIVTKEKTSYQTYIDMECTGVRDYIYSTTSINPEGKKELMSESMQKTFTYHSTGYLTSLSSYEEEIESYYKEGDLVSSISYVTSSWMEVETTIYTNNTTTTTTISMPDFYSAYSEESVSAISKSYYQSVKSRLDFDVITETISETYTKYLTTTTEFISTYYTSSEPDIINTDIIVITKEKSSYFCDCDCSCDCECNK